MRKDWNPAQYARFADLRLRPAIDLLRQVPDIPDGPVCDLGCGTGVAGSLLRSRFSDHVLTGLDASPAMLERAKETGHYDETVLADIAQWMPDEPQALIFSNAALHWIPDHATLLPRLAGLVRPGGVLAVQVPDQNAAPSHRTWLDLAAEIAPGRLDADSVPGIPVAERMHGMLAQLGRVDMWETSYFQILPAAETGHPVRHFTSSTFARPVLDILDPGETERVQARYDAAMDIAYPRRADGTVVFPFRRRFFTLDIP